MTLEDIKHTMEMWGFTSVNRHQYSCGGHNILINPEDGWSLNNLIAEVIKFHYKRGFKDAESVALEALNKAGI